MVEVTMKRCFILWVKHKTGSIHFEPVVFSSAHTAITHGEKLKDKRQIEDYNYSVVMCPQIGSEVTKINLLTPAREDHTINL